MYPNLYFLVKEWFGVEITAFKLINSFGFMVALAFLSAAWALTSELRRRQGRGWIGYTEKKIWVGKGADMADVLWNAFFGFLLGWKFFGFFLNKASAAADPQAFMLSGQGSLPLGLIMALILGGWRWYSGNKTKLAKPEQRTIRVWPHERVGDMIVLAAVFGFGGAKLFHNLENWDELVADPIGALTSFSGLTFYGGLICAGIAIAWYASKNKIPLWHLVDSFGPALMLAYAVGRIGCQVAGDGDWGVANSAYVADAAGKVQPATPQQFQDSATVHLNYFKRAQHGVKEVNSVADVLHAPFKAPLGLPSWTVAFTYKNNVLSEGVPLPDCNEAQWCNRLPLPVYPTPMYETIMGGLLFAGLWLLRKRFAAPGLLFGTYLVFNGLERFLIESIRVNTKYHFLGIAASQAQLISLGLIAAGFTIIALRHRSKPAVVQQNEL